MYVCMQLKISETAEPIGQNFLENIPTGPVVGLNNLFWTNRHETRDEATSLGV